MPIVPKVWGYRRLSFFLAFFPSSTGSNMYNGVKVVGVRMIMARANDERKGEGGRETETEGRGGEEREGGGRGGEERRGPEAWGGRHLSPSRLKARSTTEGDGRGVGRNVVNMTQPL